MASVPKHPIFTTVICYSKGALFTIERKIEPYEGFCALPEGPVKKGERLEVAAQRVLKEASGLNGTKMKLIGIYDDVETGEKRLPGIRSYIISFLCMVWTGEPPLNNCRWISDWRDTQLAWEHNEMLVEADEVIGMASKSRLLYAVR